MAYCHVTTLHYCLRTTTLVLVFCHIRLKSPSVLVLSITYCWTIVSGPLVYLGKWWQVMTANYFRAFYIPEPQPMPSLYNSQHESRMPAQVTKFNYCQCKREKSDPNEQLCMFCGECGTFLDCASKQEFVQVAYEILKPIYCLLCKDRAAIRGRDTCYS